MRVRVLGHDELGHTLSRDDGAYEPGKRAMVKVNEFNRREGLPAVEMGIAIHTGEVVVGNIGSDKRAKYGVVGSPVNLTARIESYTVGGQILVSDRTRREGGGELTVGNEVVVAIRTSNVPSSSSVGKCSWY